MPNLAQMSIDELQQLLSKITDPTSASPAEAVLQSKTILFLSSEIAIFKEAISNNATNLNGTLGITNKSIKELRVCINESTEKVIDSNKNLAGSQTINSWVMAFLTLALVVVGVFQVIVMNRQSNIMNKQAEIMKLQLDTTIPEGRAK